MEIGSYGIVEIEDSGDEAPLELPDRLKGTLVQLFPFPIPCIFRSRDEGGAVAAIL